MDKKTKAIIGCLFVLFFQFKVFPEFTLKILTKIDMYLSSTFGLKLGVSSLVAGVILGLIFSYSSTYLSRKAATSLLKNGNIAGKVGYISSIYMQEIKNKFYSTEKFILIIVGYFLFNYFFIPVNSDITLILSNFIYPSIPFLILFLILTAKEFLIEYRNRKGLFGTNRTEARELIDFIIKNSDNLDFTDSNGNLRRALLPEAKDAAEELISGTLGEEAAA
ncbi:MAG: hypothetical protein ACTFAL_12820 [Candidatus Electronema sp. V4]|uniref:hypothetical protein n=1 Tax=Candidatus Electronema sp. V4 TaxID=3454756 RepID=UPI0040555706